jgi:class 3 adenylate cyclase/TolB-like protein/Tfp pilus assembly protein PilF
VAHDRRIIAILAADVVGYSRLMGADEESTLDALKECRGIFAQLVAESGGREFGSVGDSLMAQFPSAVNAVGCAQAIQSRMAAVNAGLGAERRMQLRIGVHLGDVIEDQGAFFGDAVNVAARLQSLAKPGAVLISGAVHDQVRNRLRARYVDAGARQVKNIAEPVRTFEVLTAAPASASGRLLRSLARALPRRVRLVLAGAFAIAAAVALGILWRELFSSHISPRPAAPTGADVAAPEPRSLAVLPLVNMTGNVDQEYFVAGMHEALITDLSKISALRVISRTSASVYRDATKPLPQIGRELGVANVIEGSVFRAEDKVRITVQLIDAATDQHIWAESYERNIADVLTLQRELAQLIAGKIAAAITPDEARRLAAPRRVDPATYDAYLRGMFQLNRFTPEGIAKGFGYLNEAVTHDPADPLAYAGLALGYSFIGHGTGPREAFPRAKAAALQALKLDPELPEAHAALAEVKLYYDWDWHGAEQSFKRSFELNPSMDAAHAHYAWLLQLTGRVEEAFDEMKTACRLAPLTPLWSSWLAWLHWDAGDHKEAIAEARRSLELNPDFPWGWHVLGGVQAAQGQFEEAIASHQRVVAVLPEVKWGLAHTYALAGRREDARKIAAEIAMNPGPKDLLMLAAIHGALGDKDTAFRWLEAAYEARVDWFPWLANPSLVGGLRGDPRFDAMVQRLRLPARSAAATQAREAGS